MDAEIETIWGFSIKWWFLVRIRPKAGKWNGFWVELKLKEASRAYDNIIGF